MAIYTTSSSTNTHISAQFAGSIWIVRVGVYVTVSGDAINGIGSNGNKTFHIDGHLFSDLGDGIDLGNSIANDGGNNEVYISATGSITAQSSGIRSAGGSLMLINNGMINSIGAFGIYAEDGYNQLTNNGTIIAHSDGMRALDGDNALTNNGVISAGNIGLYSSGGDSQLTNTGSITAGVDGMLGVGGNNSLTNTGSISSKDEGMQSFSGSNNIMLNTGTISTLTSSAAGMLVSSGNNSKLINSGEITTQGADSQGFHSFSGTGNKLVNSGEINVLDATSNAVMMDSTTGDETRLVNTGLLSAPDIAVFGGAGEETVFNRGTIDGHVELGAGNDVFKGRDGVVNGEVRGGGGNDILIGSKADDDVLKGGSGADILKGKDGDEDLFGGGGADILAGGKDDDKLTGNGGPDIFVFGKNHGNDVIRDFTNGSDKIDLSAFGFKSKAQALNKFYELGSGSNDKLAFDFGNTTIIVKGIDMGDLNNADIII